MRAALITGLFLALTGAARAEGPRLWAGPAVAIDPAFAALSGGADWFLGSAGGVGVALAHTLPGAGDQLAAETGYGFANLVGRLRAPIGSHLRAELLGGAGAGRIRFGAPGAHTEWAPDLVLGGALGFPLKHRLELALELGTHVTLGQRAAARNAAHVSALLGIALRWGG